MRHFASLATEIVSCAGHFPQFFLLSLKGTDYFLVEERLRLQTSPLGVRWQKAIWLPLSQLWAEMHHFHHGTNSKVSEIYPKCLLQVTRHVNNKIVRKRDYGNQTKLEIMRYKKVGKDNKYISWQNKTQNPKCFEHIEKINVLLLSDGNDNDNNNSNN